MKLDLKKIKEITFGTVDITEKNGFFDFYRFTENQSNVYEKLGMTDFYNKSFASSGVYFSFLTDSEIFSFDYVTGYGSSRKFGCFDIYENRVMIKHIISDDEDNVNRHAEIKLSSGNKKVEIYFPWSKRTSVSNVEISESAYIKGNKRKYKMLSFGDSITQGYDALYPSLSYVSQLSSLLDANAVNKGIGGDVYRPELVHERENYDPDFITVAYGTNDWRHKNKADFENRCKSFYDELCFLYPNIPVYVVTPLWRGDGDEISDLGVPVSQMDALIRKICDNHKQVNVINGINLVPHVEGFFSDKYLHPNDMGFLIYSKNLYNDISKLIKDK